MSAYNKGYIQGQLKLIRILERKNTFEFTLLADILYKNIEDYARSNKCLHYLNGDD